MRAGLCDPFRARSGASRGAQRRASRPAAGSCWEGHRISIRPLHGRLDQHEPGRGGPDRDGSDPAGSGRRDARAGRVGAGGDVSRPTLSWGGFRDVRARATRSTWSGLRRASVDVLVHRRSPSGRWRGYEARPGPVPPRLAGGAAARGAIGDGRCEKRSDVRWISIRPRCGLLDQHGVGSERGGRGAPAGRVAAAGGVSRPALLGEETWRLSAPQLLDQRGQG